MSYLAERGWGVRPPPGVGYAPPMEPKHAKANDFARFHFRMYVAFRKALGPGSGPSPEEVGA